MPNDRPPDRRHPDQQLFRPSSRAPVPRQETRLSTAGAVRVYRPAALEFVDMPDRDTCWSLLGGQLRTRLTARAGRVLDWWAAQSAEGRPRAVLLGDRGLVKAEPTRNHRGAPATLVLTTRLDTASFRYLDVNEQFSAGTGMGGPAPDQPAAADGAVVPLSGEMTAFLGHLPAKAQVFLQAPFVDDVAGLDYERYYLRSQHGAGEELFVACYLMNRRRLTFASGVRRTWTGVPTAAWQLVCRQASIVDPSLRRS